MSGLRVAWLDRPLHRLDGDTAKVWRRWLRRMLGDAAVVIAYGPIVCDDTTCQVRYTTLRDVGDEDPAFPRSDPRSVLRRAVKQLEAPALPLPATPGVTVEERPVGDAAELELIPE